jgi:hypothetical protein
MADDMLIGVGVKADFSSLKTEAKASADALKQAEAAWKDAFEQLGSAAEKGSAQAQEALKQYENELSQAQARASAAARAVAEAQASAGAAASHAVPQFAAASGALRELQGNFDHNIRAAERFLSTSLGLGPALQAAFPVVGALAFAGVLFEVGKQIVTFASDAAALGRELGAGWLDGAIAQISGLGKAVKQTDDELLKLASDRDRTREKQQSDDVEHVRLTTQVDTYKKLTAGLGPENSENQQAYAKAAAESQAAGQQAGDNLRAKQLQEQIDALEKVKTLSLEAAATYRKMADEEGTFSITKSPAGFEKGRQKSLEDRKNQEVADAQYKTALKDQNDLITQKDNLILKGLIAEERGDRAGGRGSNKADEERMRADKVAFDQLRISHQVTLDEEKTFWQQRLDNYSKASAQYAEIVGKLAQITDQQRKAEERGLKEGSRQSTDELIAGKKKELEEDERINEAVTKAWEDDLKQQEESAQAATRSAEVQIEAAAKVAEARVQYALATGAISQETAAHELAAIKAKAYGDQIQVLQEELRKLQQIEGQGGNTQVRQNEVQDKVVGLRGDQNAAITQGATREANAFAKAWEKGFRDVAQQFNRVQDQILTGQISIAQGGARMAQALTVDAIKWAEKELLQFVGLNARKLVAKQATNQAGVASDAAAATEGVAITRSSALQEAFIAAKLAAVGAFKGVMQHIPAPLNFILAPIAAAAAFAGTMAWAAFEQGGVARVTGPAYLHAGERILTASQTKKFDHAMSSASVSTMSSSHSSTTINARVNQNFNNGKASSARETRASIQNLARRGKLALG